MYGSNSKIINFPGNGAGLLAHLTLNRGIYYLTQQYKDIKSNFISYFSSTKFHSFSSVDGFFKSNPHSHFTSGINQAVVFERISSSKKIQIVVYNVKDDESLNFEYLNDFIAICENYEIEVDVSFKGEQSYFNQFAGPTIVFKDKYDGEDFQIEGFKNKIWAINEFFIGKIFDVKSNVNSKFLRILEIC